MAFLPRQLKSIQNVEEHCRGPQLLFRDGDILMWAARPNPASSQKAAGGPGADPKAAAALVTGKDLSRREKRAIRTETKRNLILGIQRRHGLAGIGIYQ